MRPRFVITSHWIIGIPLTLPISGARWVWVYRVFDGTALADAAMRMSAPKFVHKYL